LRGRWVAAGHRFAHPCSCSGSTTGTKSYRLRDIRSVCEPGRRVVYQRRLVAPL